MHIQVWVWKCRMTEFPIMENSHKKNNVNEKFWVNREVKNFSSFIYDVNEMGKKGTSTCGESMKLA
jgi:hypothetical protein